jgi:queuine tRNA-ribosyltransferase
LYVLASLYELIVTPNETFSFAVHARDGVARTGAISMPRGVIRTPAFMPVGTAATVKAMYTDQVRELGADVVLGNTYHLMLRPGAERVAELGGLHKFMNWPHPILTDSGGFQVMSLSKLRKLDENGVTFQSHIDGAKHVLTPERAMEIQMAIGADVDMAFDQCPPYPASEADVAAACRRTHGWLERCIGRHSRPDQALFGIVQGGCFPHLRAESARVVASMNLPGIAVGGVSVGEPVEEMHRIVRQVGPLLPEDKPRYLMGVGSLREMAIAVAEGFDLFDRQAEDEDIFRADFFTDLDVCAIEGANSKGAVEGEFHVAGARGFLAGRRNLL